MNKPNQRKNIVAAKAGFRSYCIGKSLKENPYKRKTFLWELWKYGFLKAKEIDKHHPMSDGYKNVWKEHKA